MIGVLAVVAAAAACVPPKNLSVTTVVDGLSNPWDVAWTPDGTMLFTQRPGPIDAFVGGSVRELASPADVKAIGEGGMMGIAVDPQFASNRFVYTCFHSSLSTPATTRVVRWRVNNAFTALTNRTDLITDIPASSTIHFGCRTRFGPDGYLWVTTGDGAIGTAPQDKQSLAGRSCGSIATATEHRATPAATSCRRSTPTAIETHRASHSGPTTARRSRSSTAPGATTR